jgi:hypothetical protein
MIILELGKNASTVTNLPESLAEPKQADEKAWEKPQTSYRTRRSRDPWFDRLTTLSEVEGVSSKILFSLDSPPQADFATSGMTNLVLTRKTLSFSKAF